MKRLYRRNAFDAKQTKKSKTYLRDICLLLKNCRFHLVAPYINAFVVLFGFLSASDLTNFFSIDTALVFLSSAIHTGAIYSLNNVYDVEADKTQLLTADDFGRWNLSVKNQVARGNISKEKASVFSVILFCSSALYFYVAGGLLPAFLAAAIFSWGWAYSAPPLKLKNRFLLDLALHGLFWGSFLFLMGFSMKDTGSLHAVLPLLILIFFASVLWEFHNHFEDYYADKEAGKLTSVVRLGLRRSFYIYALLLGVAIAYSISLIPMIWSTVAFLGAMIVYLASILKIAKDNSFRTLFLPRKHFYLANSLFLLWITMSVYFQWIF
ncbi:MAG: prenyltransferase [Candidatus Bathyarchaeota archaeon]|nr:prenyltransferase [Candidatus Bathyarchaeota archaeon]